MVGEIDDLAVGREVLYLSQDVDCLLGFAYNLILTHVSLDSHQALSYSIGEFLFRGGVALCRLAFEH